MLSAATGTGLEFWTSKTLAQLAVWSEEVKGWKADGKPGADPIQAIAQGPG